MQGAGDGKREAGREKSTPAGGILPACEMRNALFSSS